jgi:hypothetical protein
LGRFFIWLAIIAGHITALRRYPTWTETMLNTATAARGGDSDQMLSAEEAALKMRLSAATLARWRVYGKGPAFRRIGTKRVVYPLSEIIAFMAKAG